MAKYIRIEGEYLHRTEAKTTVLKLYDEEFILDGVETKSEARSMLKNGLIAQRLKKNEGFKRLRTYEIVEFKDTDQKPDHTEFEKLLVKATKAKCLPEGLDNYDSEKGKIKALERALETNEKRKSKKKTAKSNVQDLGEVVD